MISLKKYMDMDSNELNKHREASPAELLTLTLDSYRSALAAMGNCGAQACPTLGPDLQRSLLVLAETLSKKLTPPVVTETEVHVEEQLQQWGVQTAEYFKERAGDVKEILMLLAHAAESTAERAFPVSVPPTCEKGKPMANMAKSSRNHARACRRLLRGGAMTASARILPPSPPACHLSSWA